MALTSSVLLAVTAILLNHEVPFIAHWAVSQVSPTWATPTSLPMTHHPVQYRGLIRHDHAVWHHSYGEPSVVATAPQSQEYRNEGIKLVTGTMLAALMTGVLLLARDIGKWGRQVTSASAKLPSLIQSGGVQNTVIGATQVVPTALFAMAAAAAESPEDNASEDAEVGITSNAQEEKTPVPAGTDDKDLGPAELVRFALPALGIVLINPLMTVIDNTFVALASSAQVAAMGPSTVLLDFPVYLFYFLSAATTNLITTRIAQQVPPKKAAQEVLEVSMRLGMLIGFTLLGFVWVAKMSVLTAVGASAEVIPHALQYVAIRKWWLPFTYLVTTMQSSLMATKDSLTPLKIIAISGVTNCIGDFILCQLFGMGLVGAGIATVFAQFVLLALMFVNVSSKGYLPPALWDPRRFPSLDQCRPVLAFAPPLVLSVSLRLSGYTMLTSGAASLGTVSLAAHQIIVGLYLFVAMLGDVLNLTTQTMLPKYLTGVNKSASKAQALVTKLAGFALVLGATTGAFLAALTTYGGGLFTSDPLVIAKMATTSTPIAVSLLATPLAVVMESVLICTKDFNTMIASSSTGTMLLYFTITTLVKRIGLPGVWWALAFMFVARAVIAALRITLSGSLARGDPEPQVATAAA